MSDGISSCHICGKESHALCSCDNCRQPYCTQCLKSHSDNKLCQLITKHVTNVSNLCKKHNGGVYTGYCLNCSVQTCDMCRALHSDHLNCIEDLSFSMNAIKERLRRCKEMYSLKEATAKNVIHETTKEISKLVSLKTELKDRGSKWKSLVANINHEMIKQVPQQMANLEEICDKMNEHQFSMQEMINNIALLENVNFYWTFYPIWLAVLEEMDSFKQLEMKIPTNCSFNLSIENRFPNISVCTTETRDFKSLMKEKENLERDVLKLEKELEETKMTSSRKIEQKMEENKRLEQHVQQLKSELQENQLTSKRKIEQKMEENKRKEQHVQQLKSELQENQLTSKRKIEQKIEENKRLEQHVQQLKSELQQTQLTSKGIQQKLDEHKRLAQDFQQLEGELEENKMISKNIEQKMIENKRLVQEVQQLKCEVEENKNISKSQIEQKNLEIKSLEQQFEKTKMELKRDIEQKNEEKRQLEKSIQHLKKELKETQLTLKIVSLDKEEMDKSIQDILRLWSDESDNITKRMDQFKTTTDMIEFLKNKIDQLKGLASMKDAPEILQSLNLLRESVMQLQSAEDRAHDRTSIATDAKSGQAVVDFVMKHILKMNDKLRDIEHKVGENKQLEQDAQQLKRELEDRKLASRDIEQKTGETKRLEQNIQQLKDELEKSKLASRNLLAEKEKETEMFSSGNGVIDKEVFMKDKTEILRSINVLRDSVIQLQSDEDVSHERTNIATDAKSGQAVVDFVMKHIFGMNDKVTQYKDEMEAKTVMLEKLENSNFNLDEKLKDLQAQILQCKQQNWKTVEENHIFCKERDELKNRVKSMEKLLNEKENEFSRMSAAVENINKSVAEKQKQIIVIQEDRDNKKHAIHELQSQLKQMQKTVLDLQRMNAQQKGLIQNQEEIISTVRCEKDELQTRLSSVAGEKLTKGNPSITDLGDPNRPMKISEKYGELYDNEWTDAMDNNKAVKECYKGLADSEIEEIIIRHLHRLLKCCYKECLAKADEQIQTLGKAFAETMCLTFDSEEEILSLPVCKEASMFRRAKSVDFAKLLFENKMLCRNVMDDWNYNYKNEKVMQLLMTSSFFEKCVCICWSMAIQDPVMYLDEDVQAETQIDKNTYKEFVKSGNTVAFVVWPALFLHKDGPLLYKGVVQAYWK